jgi:hypothetical protein
MFLLEETGDSAEAVEVASDSPVEPTATSLIFISVLVSDSCTRSPCSPDGNKLFLSTSGAPAIVTRINLFGTFLRSRRRE